MNTTAVSLPAAVQAAISLPNKKTFLSHKFGSITVELRLVTPEYAQELLSKNTNNRKLQKAYVRLFANEMKEGRWRTIHQGIAFDVDGVLLDGQHRLEAIVKNGEPQLMFIFYGLPKDTMLVVDNTKKRRAADTLAIAGYENTNELSAVCNVLLNLKNGLDSTGMTGGGVANSLATREVVLEFAKNNPSVVASAKVGIEASKGKTKGVHKRYLGAYHWMFSQIDTERADEFFRLYASQENISTRHPLYHLNSILTKDDDKKKGAKGRLTIFSKDQYMRTAWNDFIEGVEEVDRLKLPRKNEKNRDKERVPICDASGNDVEKDILSRLK